MQALAPAMTPPTLADYQALNQKAKTVPDWVWTCIRIIVTLGAAWALFSLGALWWAGTATHATTANAAAMLFAFAIADLAVRH